MDDVTGSADQLAALAELAMLFPAAGIDYWLFGGWAVDAHVGQVTRAHSDIDVAVWASDAGRLAALLTDRGWAHRPEEGEDGYTGYERGAVRLEVAVLTRDGTGDVYTPVRDGRAEWPAESFGDEIGEVAGVRLRVIGRGALVVEKAAVRPDPTTAAKDRADAAALARET